MDLVDLLRDRVARAEDRVKHARSELALAESDLRVFEEALQVELREGQGFKMTSYDALEALSNLKTMTLTLEDARTKTDIIRSALKRAGEPLSSGEIIRAVKPAISRSMVYLVISQMKESGELRTLPDGRLELIKQGNEIFQGLYHGD